jgi:hypothetical protein
MPFCIAPVVAAASQLARSSGFTPRSLDPVAWWKLDDGSGATATDSSGNGYDLALTGTPTWLGGGGLHFNAAIPQYGQSTAAGLIAAVAGLSAYTISFWARASAYAENSAAFSVDNGGSGTASLILYAYDNFNGNGFRSYLHTGVSDVGIDQNSGAAATDTWNHYLLLQRGAADREQYVNNVSVGTSSGSSNLPTPLTSVRVGGWAGGQFFTGDMREVVLLDRAATDGERSSLAAYFPPA